MTPNNPLNHEPLQSVFEQSKDYKAFKSQLANKLNIASARKSLWRNPLVFVSGFVTIAACLALVVIPLFRPNQIQNSPLSFGIAEIYAAEQEKWKDPEVYYEVASTRVFPELKDLNIALGANKDEVSDEAPIELLQQYHQGSVVHLESSTKRQMYSYIEVKEGVLVLYDTSENPSKIGIDPETILACNPSDFLGVQEEVEYTLEEKIWRAVSPLTAGVMAKQDNLEVRTLSSQIINLIKRNQNQFTERVLSIGAVQQGVEYTYTFAPKITELDKLLHPEWAASNPILSEKTRIVISFDANKDLKEVKSYSTYKNKEYQSYSSTYSFKQLQGWSSAVKKIKEDLTPVRAFINKPGCFKGAKQLPGLEKVYNQWHSKLFIDNVSESVLTNNRKAFVEGVITLVGTGELTKEQAESFLSGYEFDWKQFDL